MQELLKKLSSARGVSGDEKGVAAVVSKLMQAVCDEVTVDSLGSVIGKRRASCPHPTRVLLEAHMDEVGLMVKEVTEDGFLLFAPIGGIDPKILPGAEVTVHGRSDIYGVIGAKPPHLSDRGKDALFSKEMFIDVGMDEKEVRKYVRVGDSVTFRTDYTPLLGSRAAMRCADDRAGLAVILKAAEEIKNPCVELYLSASVQEEVGLRGAGVAAKAVRPDLAVAVDVTHGDVPDAGKKVFSLGKGPAVLIGPNAHPLKTRALLALAQRKGIPYQIEVDGDGDSGTDAASMQVAGEGIATMLLSVPLRYMHTTYEVMDVKDAIEAAGLLADFINEQ